MDEFTGERVIPGQVEIDLWNEHVSRYAFASEFAAEKRVLDIGCGTGYGAAELTRRARTVIAFDISPVAAQYGKVHYPLTHLHFAVASACSLPFASSTFDLITAFEVIEHLYDWRALLTEVRRVLAPGGLFLVSTPNKAYYSESRGTEGENQFHTHEFEAAEWESELASVFPHQMFLLQNRSEAFVFYPRSTFGNATIRMDGSGGNPEQAHFFMAVCSNQPLPAPRTFVYVPRAANVLREREQHIRKLEGELALNQEWLEQSRTERHQLLQALEAQKEHLEQQNRWALGLEREWKDAVHHIVELDEAYTRERTATAKSYEAKIKELEDDNQRKTGWALETERRLTAEIDSFKAQTGELARALDVADATVAERTLWAQDLQHQLEKIEAQLNAVRASRWVRSGKLFGVGPKV